MSDLAQVLVAIKAASEEPDCEAFLSTQERMILNEWPTIRAALERQAKLEAVLQELRDADMAMGWAANRGEPQTVWHRKVAASRQADALLGRTREVPL